MWLCAACVPSVSKGQSPVRLDLPAQKSMYRVESGLKSCCCMNDLPKGPIFTAWFPASGTILEGSGNSRRGDHAGGCRSWEVGPWVSCTWVFHFSLFCKQLSFTCLTAITSVHRDRQPWTKLSKTLNKNISSLKQFSQVTATTALNFSGTSGQYWEHVL